jgi:hypothetical protein
MPDYNVFELGLQQSLGSPLFSLFSLFSLPLYRLTAYRYKGSFYKRGLLEHFPPSSPTLINLHSITLNGCLVRIRSRSQPYNHLRKPLSKACAHAWLLALPALQHLIQFQNLKFESERVAPLSPLNACLMCWLAGA